ncbi:MAG: hypothetical protein GX568_10220 [Candidatus Gastranaerophilales bacterium]|nr:hypothetical protein [Candidatus Gastranaerophilales bacterium]
MLDNTEKIKVCDLARLAKKFTEPSVDTSYVSLFLQDLKKIPEWCNFDNKKLSGEESMGTLSTSSKDALSISSTLCDNHMLHSIVNLYPMNINSDNWDDDNWDDDDWDDDDWDDDDFDDDDWDDEKKSEVINHSYQNIDLLKQITIKALRNTGYEAEINNKLEPESLEDQINSLIGEKDLGLLDLNDPKPYDDFPKFDYKQEWERLSDDASWMNPEQED